MRAPRIDGNHNLIVAALRDVGASVTSLAAVGCGFPDLCCGYQGKNYLLEIKTEKGMLTPYQRALHSMWRGRITVVRSPEEALRAIGAIR